jgi:hypothetical protein
MNAPILSRTMLFARLRDGTLRHLDFNLVGTSLGAMLEPRTLIRANGAMVNEDVYDSNFTDFQILDGAGEALLVPCGLSSQWPKTFNSQ